MDFLFCSLANDSKKSSGVSKSVNIENIFCTAAVTAILTFHCL
jgi:hypothetical protein